MQTTIALDVLSCPLNDINLIEASAGTGKTWTIAALFTRLLLEESGGDAPPSIDQILVVTYTKAATAELRDRLRKRLTDLSDALKAGQSDDPFLQGMISRFAAPAEREQALNRLTAAITGFDAAAIYTIHGFCQRVLTDAAFESGQTFEAELLTEDDVLLQQVVDDFWRTRVVGNKTLAQVLAEQAETPDSWLREIRPFLSKPYLVMQPPEAISLDRALQRVKTAWAQLCDNSDVITQAMSLLQQCGVLNARSYSAAILARLADWLALYSSTSDALPLLSKDELNLLTKATPEALQKATKKGMEPPSHGVFDLVASWLQAWEGYIQAVRLSVAGLKLELINWVNQHVTQRRAMERSRGFDDLLTDLHTALTNEETGPMLAAHVARTFRIALIDEFQDTDPIQYAIFRSCFVRQQRPVFLVGDPKQAIYSFRGADIFAYLQARNDASRHYTLDTNRRSDAPLVQAVNTLFQRDIPFVLDDIRYQPVGAQPASGGRLQLEQGSAPFVFQWHPPEDEGKLTSKQRMTDAVSRSTANEISQLLQQGRDNKALIERKGMARPVTGGDIAVLVFTHRQGNSIRDALATNHIPSVALTQESVFASQEARDMLYLLRAWAEPASERLLRVALVTELIGLNAGQLVELVDQEAEWEKRLLMNGQDHQRWRDHGFMVAWRHFFAREHVAGKLLPLADGERRLTNLSHLAELVQKQNEAKSAIMPLLTWFEQQVAHPPSGEESLLRLESDADLVKIVTVHTSKGLQYPIVFCPFLWDGTLERRDTSFWRYHHNQQSCLVSDVAVSDEIRQQSRTELLAEKLRLLYVALTRAEYRQYVAWGAVKDMQTSALSWLLNPAGANDVATLEQLEPDTASLYQQLRELVTQHPDCMALQLAPEQPAVVSVAMPVAEKLVAKPFHRSLSMPWRISSFSALAHHVSTPVQAERPDYDAQTASLAMPIEPVTPEEPVYDRFSFPRGAHAGTCLHDIFEHLEFSSPLENQRDIIAQMLAKHGFAPHWQEAAIDLVQSTLLAELDPGVYLARALPEHCLVELEFVFPVDKLDVKRLIQILTYPGHGLAEPIREAAATLGFSTVQGYIKGFMDLLVQIDNKVYLVDYKSNYLGDSMSDYNNHAICMSVAREHYYLQYLIYTVALKRYYASRKVDLMPIFGGVRYLYLRGISAEGGGIWKDQPSPALIKALDEWFTDSQARHT